MLKQKLQNKPEKLRQKQSTKLNYQETLQKKCLKNTKKVLSLQSSLLNITIGQQYYNEQSNLQISLLQSLLFDQTQPKKKQIYRELQSTNKISDLTNISDMFPQCVDQLDDQYKEAYSDQDLLLEGFSDNHIHKQQQQFSSQFSVSQNIDSSREIFMIISCSKLERKDYEDLGFLYIRLKKYLINNPIQIINFYKHIIKIPLKISQRIRQYLLKNSLRYNKKQLTQLNKLFENCKNIQQFIINYQKYFIQIKKQSNLIISNINSQNYLNSIWQIIDHTDNAIILKNISQWFRQIL